MEKPLADPPSPSGLHPPPCSSAGHAPLRQPHSLRRTTSIDMTWPGGYGTSMSMDCRARDILTGNDGLNYRELAADSVLAMVANDRKIEYIEASPARPSIRAMVGARGGGGLREILATCLPEERDRTPPLYLLLDDMAGASLIGGWAWSRWQKQWLPKTMSPDDPVRALAIRSTGFGDV